MAPSTPESNKYRCAAISIFGFLLIALAGCSSIPSKVGKARNLHRDGRFEQLAAMEVTCAAADEGCNQLHLLKGDACFRAAKTLADRDTRRSALGCAADELTTAIEQTKAWGKVLVDRSRVYENACEAARLRADLGDRRWWETVLAADAERFLNFAPDHPGAIYYAARADFYKLTQSQNPCNGLQILRGRVDAALQRFQTDPRYGGLYQALRGTIEAEQGKYCGNSSVPIRK